MKNNHSTTTRIILLVSLITSLVSLSTNLRADTGSCGGQSITLPFTDVAGSNIFFCSIASAYLTGLTTGTGPTTFSPSDNVPREQMAAFITRTMDQSLKRGSRRAALNQYWTTQTENNLALTTVGSTPRRVQSDGADLWVANLGGGGTVSRVRASDGKPLETWTGATSAYGVLCAMGKVFVTGDTTPGNLYQIDPTLPAGPVTLLSSALGTNPKDITYDGQRIWTANVDSVSIITLNPVSVTNVTTGFVTPNGILYDGANIWVVDSTLGSVDKLHKLDSGGGILLSVDVGNTPSQPIFDGTNIWVPNLSSASVSVVRATGSLSGTVLATLTGNGLQDPFVTAFDGERIMVANLNAQTVSLWKATDFTPIGTAPIVSGAQAWGLCSDGLDFWITMVVTGPDKLARL